MMIKVKAFVGNHSTLVYQEFQWWVIP